MRQSSRARTAAYVVTFAWSIALFIAGVQVPGALSKSLAASPTVIVACFWIFDHLLWRQRPLRRLAQMPNLRGTWKGTLVSHRANDDGVVVVHPPIPVFLTVDQTYTSVSIRLFSAESSSRSFATAVQKGAGQEFTLYYHYSNKAKMPFRRWSPIHDGASRIDIAGTRPAHLAGEYWTDRHTQGTYELIRMTDRQYYSWRDASKAENQDGEVEGWIGRIGSAGRLLGRAIRRMKSGIGRRGR